MSSPHLKVRHAKFLDSSSALPLLRDLKRTEGFSEEWTTAITESESRGAQGGKCGAFKKVRGLLFMLLSVIFIDLARFLVKYAFEHQPSLTSMQNSFVKFVGMLLIAFVIAISTCQLGSTLCSVPRSMVPTFLMRSMIFTTVIFLQSFGIKMLTYSTAVILSFIAPLFAPFTAFLILRERLTVCNLLALIICFGGVIIFTNPQFFGQVAKENPNTQQNSLLGILLMLGSAVARAFDITFMKMLNSAHKRHKQGNADDLYVIKVTDVKHHDLVELTYDIDQTSLKQLTVLFYLSLVGSVVGGVAFGVEQGIEPDNAQGLQSWVAISCIFGSSVLVFLSQFMYSLATKYEDVGKLASVFYFQIVMAFLWEALVFKGNLGVAEILGTVIILVTSLTVAFMKILRSS